MHIDVLKQHIEDCGHHLVISVHKEEANVKEVGAIIRKYVHTGNIKLVVTMLGDEDAHGFRSAFKAVTNGRGNGGGNAALLLSGAAFDHVHFDNWHA